MKKLYIFIVLVSLWSCQSTDSNRKPNIVMILVDDLGWRDVGFNGSQFYETPNIDKLAKDGMIFTNAYSSGAICSPSRASIQTGKSPARLKITDWIRAGFQMHEVNAVVPKDSIFRSEIIFEDNRKLGYANSPLWMNLEEQTLAEMLEPQGYTSAHIGKWHLGLETWYPEDQGYDVNIGGCDFGQPPTYFDPYYSDNWGAGDIPTLPARKKGEYLTDRESDEACKFIEDNKERPFFLHLAHYAVHSPLGAKDSLVQKYKGKKIVDNQNNATYAAMIESLDQAVGRVISKLDELGLSSNTIVIFASDNGGESYYTDNSPLRAGKGTPYEGGIRVPLAIKWPGIVKSGAITDEPVIGSDFFPTFAALCNAEMENGDQLDGVSLLPILEGEQELKREAVYWHYPHYRGKKIPPYSIIRKGDWKLIKQYEGKEFQLFNLKNDMSEEHDLAELNYQKVIELNQDLENWLKKEGAVIPVPNPNYNSRELDSY